MPVFKDEAEVYRYIGGIFEEALADPVIGQKFADSGVILKVTHTEPDCVFTVDMPAKKVLYGDDARNGPKPRLRPAGDRAPRQLFGLSFESRPPPLTA